MNATSLRTIWQSAIMLISSLLVVNVNAAGLLTPADGSLPALELKDHHVYVVIEDGYAITSVEQVFHNPHSRDLEAIYSFPVPEHGTVSEFTLWIDGKPVTGEVLEKQAARQVYEEEKAAGRDAGLTEKDSYRTFDLRVSPVRAGQDTRTRLVYLQPAPVDTGIGRYNYPLEEGGVDEAKLAFWTANDEVTGTFSFDLKIKSAYPVDALRVPNRPDAKVIQHAAGEWSVHIGHSANNAGQTLDDDAVSTLGSANPTEAIPQSNTGQTSFHLDKDLVVYWRLQPGLPGSVDLIAHKPEAGKRGTFMLVVTPGDDLKPIREGRDWVFVLDISGSMKGKYATLADGVQRALKKMRPEDRFRIVLFNNLARELTSGFITATPEEIAHYSRAVANISPSSGTNLYQGLITGLDSLEADRTSAIVLVTDGVANVGETRQRQFVELIKRKDIRLFTMVMGNSANRPMLETMTRESGGFAVSISNSDDIVGQLLAATSKVNHEALHGVKLEISGIKTADLTPRSIGTLYRGEQLVIFGHYWGDGIADVRLTGKISGQKKEYRTRFEFPSTTTENPEIERLWAYARIEDLQEEMEDFGEQADMKQAIVDLGTGYGLVTDYTSMVVVRDEVFDNRGIQRGNKSRLATEQAAREQRAQRTAQSRRVDNQQPMYSKPRASYSGGGGSFDIVSLLLFLPLLWAGLLQRREPAT